MVSQQGDFGDEEGNSLKWKEDVREGYLKALCAILYIFLLITSPIDYRHLIVCNLEKRTLTIVLKPS